MAISRISIKSTYHQKPRHGWAPDPPMVGIRSPIGLVVGSCTSHPGVLGSIPKREEPGKTGAPCVKVPGSSRVPHSPSAPPPSFTQSPYPPRSLVRDKQTHPHKAANRLVCFSHACVACVRCLSLAPSHTLLPHTTNQIIRTSDNVRRPKPETLHPKLPPLHCNPGTRKPKA